MSRLLAVVAALAATGCAHLKVEVAMFDASYWSSPEKVVPAKIARRVAWARSVEFYLDRDDRKARVAKDIAALVPAQLASASDVGKYQEVAGREIDDAYGRMKAGLEQAYQLVRQAQSTSPPDAALLERADEAYSAAIAEFPALRRTIEKELHLMPEGAQAGPAKAAAGAASEAARALAEAQAEKKATLGNDLESTPPGLIGDAGILDDPHASDVLYAPDERWQKTINRTLCDGYFGNTDCAVKMEGIGSFTIKGVRLDAAKITQATFSAASQTIQVVAAAAGVPRSTGGDGQGKGAAGAAPSSPQPDVAAARSRRQQAEATLLRLRLTRLAILDAIAGEQRAIAGTPADRDAAVRRLQQLFDAYEDVLTSAGKGGGS